MSRQATVHRVHKQLGTTEHPHSPCIYVYRHTYTHTNIYTHTYMCKCVCIYIYIYIFCCCCLVTKMCSTLCNPVDCSLPGSSVYGISQASILEWVAISFFRGSSQPRDLSTPQLQSESESCSVMSSSLWPHGLHSPWNSPGQNTGVGSHSLRQQIFPTQGSNPGLPHCRQIVYQLNHQGNPRILEWVATPFSRGSSWPRN